MDIVLTHYILNMVFPKALSLDLSYFLSMLMACQISKNPTVLTFAYDTGIYYDPEDLIIFKKQSEKN